MNTLVDAQSRLESRIDRSPAKRPLRLSHSLWYLTVVARGPTSGHCLPVGRDNLDANRRKQFWDLPICLPCARRALTTSPTISYPTTHLRASTPTNTDMSLRSSKKRKRSPTGSGEKGKGDPEDREIRPSSAPAYRIRSQGQEFHPT